jgi:hypothetical protein
MDCECPHAGWCARHKITKSQRWHELCQRDDYRNLWDMGIGPGQQPIATAEEKVSTPLIDAQRKHWSDLHTFKLDPWNSTEAERWYRAWKIRIPMTGCACNQHWAKIVSDIPPRFESQKEFFEWSVEAHNAVNQRLGKSLVSLDSAINTWINAN